MNWVQLIDVVGKLVTELAIVLGGGWGLYKFVLGRTYKARLQLRVSGERVSREGLEFVVVRTELSNVGLARVKLVNEGCATTVYAHRLPRKTEFLMEPRWEVLGVFELFKDQHWVEPSGLLLDQQLLALPGLSNRFLRVSAHVESRKVAWNAATVIASTVEPASRSEVE